MSDTIIDKIVDAYKERRADVKLDLMKDHGNDHSLTGVSEGSLKGFLGGTWKPLIDLIVSGDIKGIAGVVGCSNLTAGGHDVLSVELTKELIAKDIIVPDCRMFIGRDRKLWPDDTGSSRTCRTEAESSL